MFSTFKIDQTENYTIEYGCLKIVNHV
jgi:hypothetical protein